MELHKGIEYSDGDHARTETMRCTDRSVAVAAGKVPDEDTIPQQQLQSVACEDCVLRDETGPRTTRLAPQEAQPPPPREHPTAPGRRNSDHQVSNTSTADEFGRCEADAIDVCNIVADVGVQQHPAAAHEDAASTAHMSKGLQESSRLSFSTVAILRHGAALWRTRARGRAWCLRLGMTASSWDGWAKMHVHPFVAISFYFLSFSGITLSRIYIVTGLSLQESVLFYAVALPYVVNLGLGMVWAAVIFRFGPQIVFHRIFSLLLLSSVVAGLPVWYVGYIGPQETVPWNNRFKFLVVSFAERLFEHLAGAAGALPGDHPVEPRTSIRKPVYRAIIQTLRLTDSLTDLSLIVELVAERRRGCWLFGVPGRCGAWNWLLGLFCTFAAIDFIVALGTSVGGRESMHSSKAKERIFFFLQCTALVCELGIVACTLVHLYNLRHHGNAAREDFSPTQQNSNLGVTFASLATTLITFTFSLVDTSKALAAARSAVATVTRNTATRVSQVAPSTLQPTA